MKIIAVLSADDATQTTSIAFAEDFYRRPLREQASILASLRSEIDGAWLDAIDAREDELDTEIAALAATTEKAA
jgi:hypothetical protein